MDEHAGGRTEAVHDTELSAVLTAVATIFGRSVTATDNFFDLGGNSLDAFRLVALLEAAGYRLQIEDVLDPADLRGVADRATRID